VKLALVVVAALAVAPAAAACTPKTSLAQLESEVMCIVCKTTLDQSNSAFADRERAFIRRRASSPVCASKAQIKRELVAQFGPQILAAPPKRGFDLLAWLLPIAGILAAAVAIGALAWRWSRGRDAAPVVAGGGALDPELERRLDEELARFEG
jgi:cytochrome c-type biogenesis protein CcmH